MIVVQGLLEENKLFHVIDQAHSQSGILTSALCHSIPSVLVLWVVLIPKITPGSQS